MGHVQAQANAEVTLRCAKSKLQSALSLLDGACLAGTCPFSTWHDISQSNGGHGDEAEIECLEEGPVLPDGEDAGSYAEEDGQKSQSQEGRQQV